MAQISINAYDADVFIPEFKGLMQYGDQMGGDLRFSPNCMNVETPGGVLQPSGVFSFMDVGFEEAVSGEATLMRFYNTLPSSWKGVYYILACNGKLFSGEFDSTPNIWTPLSFPSGITSYQSNKWSWVVYEYVPAGQTDPVNALIISNEKDGMFSIVGSTVTKISGAPKKFSHIEVFADRIWGCGAKNETDSIYYSRPFSFSDWSQDNADPANGGGYFREPMWDKDKINCLKRYGDSLIAFSETRAWKITGTDPSNISVQEQYGNGTKHPESVVAYRDKIYMFRDTDGICVYDGYMVSPIVKMQANTLFEGQYFSGVCGTIANDRYICHVYYGYNSHRLITYSFTDSALLLSNSPRITSFCKDYDYAVVSGENEQGEPYIGIVHIGLDSWKHNNNLGLATRWTTPWITFGRQDIKKGGFDLYFTPEVKDTAVTLRFTIQTEKKSKVKNYTVTPLTSEEKAAGKQYKMKRLHFGGSGRRFRLIIETDAGNTGGWRLIGGVHIIAEIDKD